MGDLAPIKDLLGMTIDKLSHNKKLKVSLLWDKEFKSYAKHTQLVALTKGELKIHVDSAVWKEQLNRDKRQIITRLNEHLGAKTIKDIHFAVGEINHS
jgi:predicted nucleic acid-binding Zn ribbon protein